jgi:hypothetical protein
MRNNKYNSPVLTIVLIIFLFTILGCVCASPDNGKRSSFNDNLPMANATPLANQINRPLSSEEKLQQGLKAYNERKLDLAKSYLSEIAPTDFEYKKARIWLNKIKIDEDQTKKQQKEEAKHAANVIGNLINSIRR